MRLSSARPWSEPKAMIEPAPFTLRFPARCVGCNKSMPAGERAIGLKLAGARHWTVWHSNVECDALARRDLGFAGMPTTKEKTAAVGTNEWLTAYDKE